MDTTILPIIMTAFIPMVVGMIWYAKSTFGARWMRYEGVTSEMEARMKNQPMAKKMITAYIGYLLMAYTLSVLVNFLVVADVIRALQFGFLLWIGIAFPVSLTNFLWSVRPKPWGWLILNNGYVLVSILLMTVVMALWI